MAYGIDNNTVFFLRGDSYLDLSANNRAMTNYGSVIGGETSGKFGPGINFHGSRLTVTNGTADINWTGDFTVEWWECVYGSMTDPASGSLFYNRITTGSNFSGVLIGYAGTRIYTGNNTASWNGFNSTESKSLTTNTWVHWAFVKQGTTWRSYRNGALYWSATNTVVPSACDNGLSIGAWYDGSTHANYNATICEYRVSNVARYSANFTPRQTPMTSVGVSNILFKNNFIVCALTKSSNETVNKIELLINGVPVKTYTTWTDSVEFDITDNEMFVYGNNSIEVRAYYYNDYYVSKNLTITRTIDKLTNSATFEDVTNRFERIRLENEMIANTLARILASKGIAAGDNPKMSYLVTLVGQMSGTSSSNTTEYLNQISTLTSQVNNLTTEIENNKLALVNALIAKNIECSVDEEYSSLITKINLLEEIVGPRYLYKSGDICDSITGGYITKYSFTSASATYNTSDILIKANAGTSGGASVISTKSMIDITKYKYLKARVNINSASTNGGFMLYVKKTFGTYPWNDNIAVSDKYKTLGAATITLDISTLSGSHYIALGIDAGSSGSATMSATVYELWLE